MSSHSELEVEPRLSGILPTISLSQSIISGLAALIDVLISFSSGMLIFWLYVIDEPEKVGLYLAAVALYSLLMLQSFHMAGLYRFTRILTPHRQIVILAGICVVLFLVLTTCVFALKISLEFSRVWAFSWLITNVTGIVAARFALYKIIRRLSNQGQIGRKIAIYGGGEQGTRLIRHIDQLHEPWNRIVGIFDDRTDRVESDLKGYPLIGNAEDLVDWCRAHDADEVLIALPWGAQDRILEIISLLAALPVNVRLSPEFIGTDLLHRRTSNQFRIPMLSVLEKPVAGWGAITKSILDYVVAASMLILVAPLLLIVICAIKLDSPGPIFFRQKRYGFNSQLIEVYKFRSMYADQTDHHAEMITRKDDPRVTRVGAIIRRFSIDELPQILNVLTGDMSVVGPRPHALQAKAGNVLYEDVVDQYAVRHKVKPGITGWAQINGWRGDTRDEASLIGRLEHDLYYIDHWSVLFDLSIIFRTFFVVLRGENSY
jgi:Undecaprenyl-phosphate glucose phosphotransferase